MEETPFRLAFGMKAIIPLDIELLMLRAEHYDQQNNQAQLLANLDFLDSVRKQALIWMAIY